MSWLFGGGGGDDDNDNDNNEKNQNYDNDYDDDDDDDITDRRKAKVIADFDSTSLVEGADALKQIDSSPNSKEVLRLQVEAQKTKQIELRNRGRQMERANMEYREALMKREAESQKERDDFQHQRWKEKMEEEQRRKEQSEQRILQQKQKAQQEWIEKQRQLNEENLQKQRQVQQEIEENRKKTLQYQAELDRETARVAAEANAEGQIKVERENEEIHLRAQKEKIETQRVSDMELLKEKLLFWKELSSNAMNTLTDPQKMTVIGSSIVGIGLTYYGGKTAIGIAGRHFEKSLGKPTLVRDTSRWSWKDVMPGRHWFNREKRLKALGTNEEGLKNLVLAPSIKNRMQFISRSAMKTKANKAPFRHLLIYGPPGTGKTLFAKTMSHESGLDYAVLTGGDISQLGNKAVTELHKVFDWAETSKKGTILFIDEADAFLRKGREGESMSEDLRNALSAFLYRTGTETKNFMVVLATNVPSALDKAVLDRIDDVVEFPLPGAKERKELLQLYFKKYITDTESNDQKAIVAAGFDTDYTIWDRLTEKTEDFSGRQIAKYMIQVQHTMYGGNETEVTPFLMEQILETFLKSKFFEWQKDNAD